MHRISAWHGAAVLYERPEHTSTDFAGPRVRVAADAQVRFHPNISAVAAGAVDHQFLGLDASFYSYERDIDLGYDRDENFDLDLDLFGEMNESESDDWEDGRLSPSLGFQVAFAP